MAGLVGLIEKSGGLKGITESLKKYVKTSRSAQAASLFSGVIIFFDDRLQQEMPLLDFVDCIIKHIHADLAFDAGYKGHNGKG